MGRILVLAMVSLLTVVLGAAPSRAQRAYIANSGSNTVSVIDTAGNTVVGSPIAVGFEPEGVAVTPDGSRVYVTNFDAGTVSVIAAASNTVLGSPIGVGSFPIAVAASPDGSRVYVASNGSGSVSVIATASNTVIGGPITVGSFPEGVVVTPDGSKVYVANFGSSTVSVIATASNTVTATIPVGNGPAGVAVTPDGSIVYLANFRSGTVSAIATASDTVIGGPITVGSFPAGVAVTPDGSAVYVANEGSNNVSIISTASNTVIGSPVAVGNTPAGVAVTPDGREVYVANLGTTTVSVIATASNTVTATILVGNGPYALGSFIGPAPQTLFAAVLPLSRSVQVGVTATVFATIINAGTSPGTACSIAPAANVPASFVYQTTNPNTNALIGTVNTPVDIAPGAAQSFVVALTPTAAFAPTNVTFAFACAGTSPVMELPGVNTLELSASAGPVPDIVALAASADPGFVDIPGDSGTGVFAVATVNLGVDDMITATANTGNANLPVTLALCQTNPQTGNCLAAPASNVTIDIQANATPTFGIFATGGAAVANLPGVNRVFVTFTDSGGTLRGETSVAVRTQ